MRNLRAVGLACSFQQLAPFRSASYARAIARSAVRIPRGLVRMLMCRTRFAPVGEVFRGLRAGRWGLSRASLRRAGRWPLRGQLSGPAPLRPLQTPPPGAPPAPDLTSLRSTGPAHELCCPRHEECCPRHELSCPRVTRCASLHELLERALGCA